MASGISDKYKLRPNLGPYSGAMVKAVASIAVVALHHIQSANGLTCYCQGHCPHTSQELSGTCHAKPGAKCFAAVEMVIDPDTNENVPERTYGCLPPEESGLMQCRGSLVPHLNPANISCCSDEDMCNRDLLPMYTPLPPDSDYENTSGFKNATLFNPSSVALLVSLAACVILTIFVAFIYLRCKKREDDFRKQKYMQAARQDPEIGLYGGTLSDLIEQSSGSGSRLPVLVQRTIARSVDTVRVVGKGRYGEVWLGKWRGEDIAVKIFFTTDEDSWFRETEIYQTTLMRHDNILGFIAADIKGNGDQIQMMLITDYHPNGSLYDFLKNNTIDEERMLIMAHSAAAGISHLHTEIQGTRGKQMIAHRDIKTKNILVKRDLTCVIADFGLAVRYDSETKQIDVGNNNTRVGTRRYMAPEVLDGTLKKDSFEAFLHADMYSFALVLWELCRRTLTGDKNVQCEHSELPYYEYVNPDPTEEEMRALVCNKNIRPTIPERWICNETLFSVSNIMQESWNSKPSSRLSHLRVKKAFAKLIDNTVDIKRG